MDVFMKIEVQTRAPLVVTEQVLTLLNLETGLQEQFVAKDGGIDVPPGSFTLTQHSLPTIEIQLRNPLICYKRNALVL